MKYIIIELIPTKVDPKKGDIIQLSALKIDDLKLVDRFDYRLNDDKIELDDLKELINYDKENFIYKNTTEEIMEDFKNWIENDKLIIINNEYTLNYLKELTNQKDSISDYLNIEHSDYIIDEISKKYNLEKTNYIVDLMYEAMIYEENNKSN